MPPAIPTSPSRTGHRCQHHPPAAPLVLLAQSRPCPCAAGVSATTSLEPFRAWAEEVRNQGTELLLWLVPSNESTIYVYISLHMSMLCCKSQNGSHGLTTTWSIPHPTPQPWCCPIPIPRHTVCLLKVKMTLSTWLPKRGYPSVWKREFSRKKRQRTHLTNAFYTMNRHSAHHPTPAFPKWVGWVFWLSIQCYPAISHTASCWSMAVQ